MTMHTRRQFVAGSGAVALAAMLPRKSWAAGCDFKVGVISDEISEDLDHACYVIAKEFGLRYVELRGMYGKNLQNSSDADLAKAEAVLQKYDLQVTDIASPLFKVNWPGAPPSTYSSPEDLHGAKDEGYNKQGAVLDRSIALAKRFKTNKVRCFDFWRIEDVKPYRAAINAKLDEAATAAGKQGILLVLENEFECNTATGREAAATLAAVQNPHLALNWDPGNAVMRGELDAFPNGWAALPKNRIHHCHVKNAIKNASGKIVWSPVDEGYVDWTAQFKALHQVGYTGATTLETHWRGAGTPEASTRRSWAGMKKCLEQAGCM